MRLKLLLRPKTYICIQTLVEVSCDEYASDKIDEFTLYIPFPVFNVMHIVIVIIVYLSITDAERLVYSTCDN